jgi:hypothetical protein
VPDLKLPGARTGIAYVWAMFLGPPLLLVAGVILLGLGFWRHVGSVAAIGAIGIVASLVLPRMQGAFEIGPSGIKGDLENEVFREVIEKARASGLDAERALELGFDAERALPPWSAAATSREQLLGLFRAVGSARTPRPMTLADMLATGIVQESVRLESDTATIVERVAKEKRWQVKRHARVESAADESSYRIFDFVITTRKGLIFIDSANFRSPENLSNIVASVGEALQDQKNLLAAFLVVPNVKFSAYVPENLQVVPVGDLERQLREIQA